MSYYRHSQRINQHPWIIKTPVATNNQGFLSPVQTFFIGVQNNILSLYNVKIIHAGVWKIHPLVIVHLPPDVSLLRVQGQSFQKVFKKKIFTLLYFRLIQFTHFLSE